MYFESWWPIKKDRQPLQWLTPKKSGSLISDREVESLNINLYLWAPIHKGYCTLEELKTVYDITDLMDMHESILVFNKLEERASE